MAVGIFYENYFLKRKIFTIVHRVNFGLGSAGIAVSDEACRNRRHPIEDHFEDILEMVDIGSGAS